ncbi:hypothetical protein FRC12_020263 [Ceratobasidium sp. 428]|nr:hypothetical protein FRC12_020263 [Ceratobasidium sp. 428]
MFKLSSLLSTLTQSSKGSDSASQHESISTSGNFEQGPRPQGDSRSHLIAFFKEYPEFDYDPMRPYMEQFHKMAGQFGWGITGQRYKKAHDNLRYAAINQFNDIYGTDPSDYNLWANIFGSLDIEDAPKDVKHCKKFARTKYVNVCNMVDAPVTRAKPQLYASEEELSKYTFATQNIFPHDGDFMTILAKSFIRNLIHPSRKKSQPGESIEK